MIKGHFRGQSANSKVTYRGTRKNDFCQIKLGTSVIPFFHVILPWKSISDIILVILGDRLGQFQSQIGTRIINSFDVILTGYSNSKVGFY